MDKILQIKNLQVIFEDQYEKVIAVSDVSLSLAEDEILGIVGESGSGKSVTAKSILRLVSENGKITKGDIYYKGQKLLEKNEKEMRNIRGNEISMIFQNPMNSFNPVFTIGNQIVDVIKRHQNLSYKEAKIRTIEMLDRVGIASPESRFDSYPHEFSGGMLQRAMIAMALACEPSILIADEPTTSLDVSVQNEILRLLLEIKADSKMSIILITHDLGVVANTCSRIVVMKDGYVVEEGEIIGVFKEPRSEYTKDLIRASQII